MFLPLSRYTTQTRW